MWWSHFLVVVLLDYQEVDAEYKYFCLIYTSNSQIIRNVNGYQFDKAFWYSIWEIGQEWNWRPFIKHCMVDSNLPPSSEIFSRINMNQENTPEQHLILHSMCELSLLLISLSPILFSFFPTLPFLPFYLTTACIKMQKEANEGRIRKRRCRPSIHWTKYVRGVMNDYSG